MSTKLTNYMREHILSEMLTARFSDRMDKLVEDHIKIADKVYSDVFSASMREQMSKLPDGWLVESDSLTVQINDVRYVSAHGRLHYLSSAIGKYYDNSRYNTDLKYRLPANRKGSVLKVYSPDSAIYNEYMDLYYRAQGLKELVKEAETVGSNILQTATTFGGLLKIWPEVRPFVSKYVDKPLQKTAVPAVTIERANALFDLPVEEAA